MLKYASWVHGNALTVESPNGILVVRRGSGTEMQFIFGPGEASPPGTWCHIGIPTPVILQDVRLKVRNMFLLFRTGQHAAIDKVHVYDGPNRISAFETASARRTGDHAFSIDERSTITLPSPHEVRFALSLSFFFKPVALTMSSPPVDPQGTLLVTTAGADFF